MIVASLLLILVAVTLLVLGLTGGSSGLLISSIVASLLAAVTLVIGARQAAAHRRSRSSSPAAPSPSEEPVFAAPGGHAESDLLGSDQPAGAESDFAPVDDDSPDVDLDDEPPAQTVTPSDAVRVARLDSEVLVVDGRPRYHLAECPTLADRETEPIGVNEAVELGFTPCGVCRPVDRLVAAAARR